MPRNKINIINGWINIFKTQGKTSNNIISDLKKIFKDHKIGHAGTLDPMATGVLPIAIGEATKTVPYIHKKNKTYKFIDTRYIYEIGAAPLKVLIRFIRAFLPEKIQRILKVKLI